MLGGGGMGPVGRKMRPDDPFFLLFPFLWVVFSLILIFKNKIQQWCPWFKYIPDQARIVGYIGLIIVGLIAIIGILWILLSDYNNDSTV